MNVPKRVRAAREGHVADRDRIIGKRRVESATRKIFFVSDVGLADRVNRSELLLLELLLNQLDGRIIGRLCRRR